MIQDRHQDKHSQLAPELIANYGLQLHTPFNCCWVTLTAKEKPEWQAAYSRQPAAEHFDPPQNEEEGATAMELILVHITTGFAIGIVT